MALANQEARRFGHEYIGTEHVLLGLIKEGSCAAANVLKKLDVDLDKVRTEVEKLMMRSEQNVVATGKLPQTPRAKKVIEYAIEESRYLKHDYVGTEHLLLGLLREHDGIAGQVLSSRFDLTLEQLRAEVLNMVPTRRTLRFEKVDEALADVRALAELERAGKLTCLGKWTFGQILGHLATWVDYSYDGVPMKVPFFVRWMVRPFKKRFLNSPMRVGGKIPKVPGGTLALDVYSSEEGVARFERSFTRLREEAPGLPHLLFGVMTHEDWIKMHLRHAELHLSFLRPV